jgi:hypothetical protein
MVARMCPLHDSGDAQDRDAVVEPETCAVLSVSMLSSAIPKWHMERR